MWQNEQWHQDGWELYCAEVHLLSFPVTQRAVDITISEGNLLFKTDVHKGLNDREEQQVRSLETTCHIPQVADSMVGNHVGEDGWKQTSGGAKAAAERGISESGGYNR